jgi:hypothetical protein
MVQLSDLNPDIKKRAMKCTKWYHHFEQYCVDIREHGGTKPENGDFDMSNLGPFSATRSVQLSIRHYDERRIEPNNDRDLRPRSRRGRSSQSFHRHLGGHILTTSSALVFTPPMTSAKEPNVPSRKELSRSLKIPISETFRCGSLQRTNGTI